jgi:type I restriction enzyme, S subunit
MMRSDSIQAAIAERVTGSTGSRQRAKSDDIASITIVAPPQELLHQFCRLVSPMHVRIDEAISESRTLAALRDALLPKLITGEVRVGDAARFVA